MHKRTYGVPDSINFYGYNGESTNLFTGLQYLRARYYDMQNGCFLSEDTVAGDQTNPLSLNRYTYVSNNPVNHADPSGHVATSRFSQTMKIDGGGGSRNTSKKNSANAVLQQDTLPSTTQGYQSAESRLTATAKEMEGFKEAAKEAEADGAKLVAEKEDKVASEDADWVNELADTVKEGVNDIGKSVCDYAGTEEGQTTIATIIACIVAVILTVVVAPYALATLGVAATSLTGYMAIMGIAGASYFGTYEYAKSSLDQAPAWETALETIQGASQGGLLGMLAGAAIYGVNWLWETVADLLMNQGGGETEEWWNVEQEGGSKTIPYTDYDNIYQSSIHNADADMVMLGKYDGGGPSSYINQAGDDYTYFSLDNWNEIKTQYGLTDDDMFKLFNEPFLDDGINAGKVFEFSHNPVGDQDSLGKEFRYLLENGYIWDESTMTMRPGY